MVLGMVQGSQYWGRMFQILPPNTYSTHGNSAEEPDLLLNDLDLMPLQTLERTPYTLLPARSYSTKKLQVILGSVSCTSLFFKLKGDTRKTDGGKEVEGHWMGSSNLLHYPLTSLIPCMVLLS